MPVFGNTQRPAINHLKNNVFSGRFIVIPILVAGLCTGSALAAPEAKDPGAKQLSLSTRFNPAYDPQGIRLGDFTLFPSLTTGVKHNDNIYATDLNKMHDLIYTVKPEARIRSDFVRHSIDAGFYLERGKYQDFTRENYDDYGADVNARVDVTGQTNVPLKLSYARQHVRRGGPDERAAIEPSFYQLWDGTLGLVHEGQRIATKVVANMQRFVFDDTVGLSGSIDNGDRDRNEYSLYTSLGMSPKTLFAPFIYANILKVNYDRRLDNDGFNRDATQYEAGIGTVVNISDITSASFTLGRLHRTMDDPNLNNIDDFTYGVNLKWEPSTLASFLLSGDRTVKESSTNGISASVASALRLSMDYELFPNLIVQPSIGIVERDYKGDRGGTTVTTDGTLQFTYKMNQNFWLTTTYQYTNQDETEDSPELYSYEDNLYGVSLKLQF